MRIGAAFEFLGSMSGNFAFAGQFAGDPFSQLFDSGIGLFDVVGNVVSLWEMKKKTRLMESVYSSRTFINFITQHQNSIEKEIAFAEKSEFESMNIQISIKRSEAEELIITARNELKAQHERYRKEVEGKKQNAERQLYYAILTEKENHELRNLLTDGITLSKSAREILLENEMRNRPKILELDDNLRKTVNLLRQTFQDAL